MTANEPNQLRRLFAILVVMTPYMGNGSSFESSLYSFGHEMCCVKQYCFAKPSCSFKSFMSFLFQETIQNNGQKAERTGILSIFKIAFVPYMY